MKTNKLQGVALNWAVAKAEQTLDTYKDIEGGTSVVIMEVYKGKVWQYVGGCPDYVEFAPSTNWAQGGPIIEAWGAEVGLSLYHDPECPWISVPPSPVWVAMSNGFRLREAGPTPLVAAMRCYVASKLGDEVDIPKELEEERAS